MKHLLHQFLKSLRERGLLNTVDSAAKLANWKIFFKKPTKPRYSRRKGRKGAVLVTPFSPFILSNYFLSDEVTTLGLQYLNPDSLAIDLRTVFTPNSVIFCQVDQLEEFAEKFLPQLDVPVTLITGKWNLPGLSDTPTVRKILENPQIVRWYSQNQIFDHLAIEPFPYGVNFFSAHMVLREMRRAKKGTNRIGLLVPFAKIHTHLPTVPKEIRTSLQPAMEKELRLGGYLKSISSAKYVISPPGDRPDTYRHWECIALGAIPVSDLPASFVELFGDNAVFVNNLPDFSVPPSSDSYLGPDARIAELSYWANQVGSSWWADGLLSGGAKEEAALNSPPVVSEA